MIKEHKDEMPQRRTLHAGDEILLKTRDGEFRGRIHLRNDTKIYLYDVVDLVSGQRSPSLRCLGKNEILSSKFLRGRECFMDEPGRTSHEETKNVMVAERTFKESKMKECSDSPWGMLQGPRNRSHSEDTMTWDSSHSVGAKMASKVSKLKEAIRSENSSSVNQSNQLSHSQLLEGPGQKCGLQGSPGTVNKSHYRMNYAVIDSMGALFQNSIDNLKTSKSIGVAFIGSSVKQETDFSWIATHSDDVYLYDIAKLGESAFDGGLRDVLESPGVVKVVYDCRVASHTLLHRHNSLLTNVLDLMAFDTIADSFLGVNHSASATGKTMSTLLSCIACNVDVDIQEISAQRHRLEEAERHPDYWRMRCEGERGNPSQEDYEEMLQAVIFEAVHLKRLKQALTKKMMGPVIDATDILLAQFRDMNRLQNLPKDLYFMPKEFKDASLLRYEAQRCRDKTAELVKSRSQNGVRVIPEILNNFQCEEEKEEREGRLANGDLEIVRTSGSGSSMETPKSQVSQDSAMAEGRTLLSRLMQEPGKEGRDTGISFVPCGSELSYKLDVQRKRESKLTSHWRKP